MMIFWNKLPSALPATNEIWSEDSKLQLRGTTKISVLLSRWNNPPTEEIVRSGAVARLVEFLPREDFPQLQLEASRALCNITRGSSANAKLVINHGAVPIFVKLLGSSPWVEVREQAVWALGNIAGHSIRNRDLVLCHGALFSMEAIVLKQYQYSKISFLRIIAWALSILCKGKPQPHLEQTQLALSALERLLLVNDAQVLSNSCWALSYILDDGTEEQIQAVIDAGLCRGLVRLLKHPSSPSILIPALQALGIIAAGNDDQTQTLIHQRALPYLLRLLTYHRDKNVKKEACWTVSNIAAGNPKQIQALIISGIIPPLVGLLRHSAYSDIKIEAAWAIANITFGGTPDQIKYLVSQGCIKPLCDQLEHPDSRIVTVCLKALEIILKVGEEEQGITGGVNLYAQDIDEVNGLDKIEKLRRHDKSMIRGLAVRVLGGYWPNRDEALNSCFGWIPVMWRRATRSLVCRVRV